MRAFYLGAVGILAAASVAWAECDALRSFPLPISTDTTLVLSTDVIDCPILEDNELEEFIIEGFTLTLTGPSTMKFSNVKFTVMDGAGLIFDFDMTEFGPNLGFELEDSFGGFMVQVLTGGFVEFTGEMFATGLRNMRSVFSNNVGGSIEFAGNAVFDDCGSNVFRDQFGRLRFRGDATFTNNRLLAIDNIGGSVRIDGDAHFVTNGRSFDGHSGGAFFNSRGGTAIFHGFSVFSDNRADESGGGVYNGVDSKMTFYKRAGFYDNKCSNGHGGGIANDGGELKFRGAVFISGNEAYETGGGIATGGGGITTFYGWTSIQSNDVTGTGGGMSLYGDGANVVTLRKPERLRSSVNEKTGDDVGCNNIYVAENSELIGPDATSDDLCDES